MSTDDFSDQLIELHRVSLELSKSKTFDQLCYRAIELGLSRLGFDRLSFWYFDKENPDYLKGSYGTDENGNIRDERDKSVLINSHKTNSLLLSGELYIDYRSNAPLFNDDGEIVGYGDIAMVGLWDGNDYIGCMSTDNFFSRKKLSTKQRDMLLIYGRTLGNLSSLKLAEEELKTHSRFENILEEITRVSIEQSDLKEMVLTLEKLLLRLFNGKLSKIYLSGDKFSTLFTYKKWELDLFRKYSNLKEKIILSDIEEYRSILLLPLADVKSHNGLILIGFEKDHIFYNDEINRAEQAVWQIALAIHKAKLFEETLRLSTIDELTGINNRRQFFLLAEREVARSIRKKNNLSLLMLDIDHFKNINDTYGHLSGDIVLKDVAEKLCEGLREIDIIGRFGGEEFVILLPDTDLEKAKIVVGRLLQSIREMSDSDNKSISSLTISGGVSILSAKEPQLKIMLEEADQALYRAKNNGRDRFEIYSPNN